MKSVNKMVLAALIGSGSLLVNGTALALDGATLYKTKTCVACHGAEAKAPVLPSYPKLAGQNAAYALQQMKDIKSGARNNGQTAAMKPVMHLVSDEEMQAIADWLQTLK
ncbi:MAG: cytochrome c [Candidatus Zixiibacteriota bacterium]